MKFLNTKPRKVIFWILIPIIVLVAVVIIFISPIAKYMVEKYDVKYSGREITMDLPYINPFTGYVHLRNLKVYEYKSDSIFFSANGISVNVEMFKLLSKTYEISSLTLSEPMAKIIQSDSLFNFTDLITKFASKDTTPKPPKPPVHFNIYDVKIKDGTFYYIEKTIPVFYFVKKVNIETDGKKWDQDTVAVKYALQSGVGTGTINGNATVNVASMDYKLGVTVNKFDLSIIEQYVKNIAKYGTFRAHLDADIKASGNIKSKEALNATGDVIVNDLHFGKDTTDDYLSFKKLSVAIIQLSPAGKKYSFDSISLVHPYFKYERYDHLDNLQNMFGKGGETVKAAKAQKSNANILFQIADYVKALAKNFFRSNFKIKRLAVYNADVKYNDYALTEKFSTDVTPLTIIADSIERSNKWVNLSLKTGLKPYGDINFGLSINPKDSSDFDIDYHLQKIPLAMFNPYLISFTSFPLDRGTLELKGNWQVRDGFINSSNRLTLVDARINNRQKRNGAKWIPLKVIMFFVRDRGNVTDFEVPIKGSLTDPKFKFHDVIMDVITNIFVKPATTRYRAEVRSTENEIEKSMMVRWDKRKSVLESDQEKFVEKMAGFLKDNPEVQVTVSPLVYVEKEKEYILFFEAKKQFYLSEHKMMSKNLSEKDTSEIEKISVKDSLFTHYLNARSRSKLLFTVQDKCKQIVSAQLINERFNELLTKRKQVFLSYFKKDGTDNRVKIVGMVDKVPFNGFSIYKINYKGEVPDDLIEAYRTINEFDNKNPRKKYKALRDKEKSATRGK